jgi:hypothetical protein
MRIKSAIVKIVDVNAAPDQPPSSHPSVAFADFWRSFSLQLSPAPSFLFPNLLRRRSLFGSQRTVAASVALLR